MIGSSLALTLGNYSLALSIEQMRGEGARRWLVEAQQADAVWGLSGVPLQQADLWEPYYLFQLNLSLNPDQFRILQLIHNQSNRLLVAGDLSGLVLLDDGRRTLVETSPRTRALVAGTSEISGAPVGFVEYYPRFEVVLLFPQDYWQVSSRADEPVFTVSFSATEYRKVSP